MNKYDLINSVYLKTKISKKDSEAAVNAVFDAITESLVNGNKVKIVGFGSFEVKHRAARVGRNPQTNETVDVPATNAPVFKASKNLKDAVS